MLLLSTLLVLVFALALRLLPMRLSPHGGGVDQWFWRAYIDRTRRQREFPPQLKQFQLDEAQWYPPLFPWLLAKLPRAVFERYAGWMAILLDLLRLLLVMLAGYVLGGDWTVAAVAGLVYALTPVLITYNIQLNPRGLGALFLDAALLFTVATLLREDIPWWPAAVFGGLVLLTHKMTTQLFVFVALVAGIALLEARFPFLLALSVVAALILSAGFYRFVFRAHVDILRFWFINWRWIGANPILESPVYGDPAFESPSKFYRKGWRAAFRRLTFVVGFNPWMPSILLVGLILCWEGQSIEKAQLLVFGWLACTFVFALMTTLIPSLRCLGQGYLYGYNGSFPAALALGLSWQAVASSWISLLICVATVIASVVALFAYFRALRTSRTLKVDEDLDRAIRRLAELPDGTVMCLPQHWHDVVAFRTGKAVAFGGHGYGFRLLQPVFPRLLIPVGQFMQQQNVAYLLVWPAYVNQRFLDDLPPSEVEVCGEYRIYRFQPVQERDSGA